MKKAIKTQPEVKHVQLNKLQQSSLSSLFNINLTIPILVQDIASLAVSQSLPQNHFGILANDVKNANITYQMAIDSANMLHFKYIITASVNAVMINIENLVYIDAKGVVMNKIQTIKW